MSKSNEEIYQELYDRVNMTPSEIEDWQETEQSKSVGQDSGDEESKGRKSAKKIVKINRKKKEELMEADYHHMQ